MQLVGRKAVLEALRSMGGDRPDGAPGITVKRVTLATTARGDDIDSISRQAERLDIAVSRLGERRVDALAGDDRMHQGVIAEADPAMLWPIDEWERTRTGRRWGATVLVLDSVHNPANVGMILRTAAAADVDAVVLPRRGTAGIGPLTIKAGSGMIFSVPLLDAADTGGALDELVAAGFVLLGLDAGGESLFDAELPDRSAFVLGNETTGLSTDTRDRLDRVVSLPLANGVESLNVAATAAVVSYELARRGRR